MSAYSLCRSGLHVTGRKRMLAFALLLLAHLAAAETIATSDLFDHYRIETGDAGPQTVLSGHFLASDVAEIAVIQNRDSGATVLRLYRFYDHGWVLQMTSAMPPGLMSVDVAHINGTDRLVSYDGECLMWFDPVQGQFRPLLEATSAFISPKKPTIPTIELFADINGDHRDDLLLPIDSGFRIFIQLDDGDFARPVNVGTAPDFSMITGAQGYRYNPWSQSRIHVVDINADGRRDIVYWQSDHFRVHLQDQQGLFLQEHDRFNMAVAFSGDRRTRNGEAIMHGRILHSMDDINADGLADLVIHSIEGEKIRRMKSSFQIYFGRMPSDHRLTFGDSPDLIFSTRDRLMLTMKSEDMNSDGRPELWFSSIDLDHLSRSPWKAIKGFMGDDVWLELDFYRIEKQITKSTHVAHHRIALDGFPSHREPGWVPMSVVLLGGRHVSRLNAEQWPRAFNTTLRIGDITGDGLSDLMIGDHPRILKLHPGTVNGALFAESAVAVSVRLPADEEYTQIVDLNRDGKQDLLMHQTTIERDAHGGARNPPGSEPNRIVVLIAR